MSDETIKIFLFYEAEITENRKAND